MKYQQLGASGLWVSPICLGTMTYGSPVSEQDAIHLTHQAIDLGINFIDTANAYEGYNRVSGSAGGVAEKILGKALKDRRDHVVLATKVGSPLGPRGCPGDPRRSPGVHFGSFGQPFGLHFGTVFGTFGEPFWPPSRASGR